MKFDTSPLTAEERQANPNLPDWAESMTEISAAQRTLEDAIPAQDAVRTTQAMKRLDAATNNLKSFLKVRNLAV